MGGYDYNEEDETKRLLPVNEEVDPEKKDKNVVVVHRTAGLFSSTINLTNTIIGAGVLGLPYAVATCGLFVGILMLFLSGLASAFGLYLLVQCSDRCYVLAPQLNASYYTCARLTYPKIAFVIDTVVFIKCFGVAVSYLIVIGDLMPDVMTYIFQTAGTEPPEVIVNRQFWIGMFALVIVPLCFLKQLHSLWFSSLLSLFTVAYLLSLVVAYFFVDGLPIGDRDLEIFTFSTKFFKVMTIFVFGFTCHQNIFSIYNELKDPTPKRINTVIFTSISSALSVYLIIAVLGYLTYGKEVEDNIINNYPVNSVAVTIGRIFIAIHVAFAVPLQNHPARICMDNLYKIFMTSCVGKQSTPQTVTRFIVETFVILSGVYLLGLTFSQLDVMLSLVGATGSTTMCYILPGLFYLKMYSDTKWSLLKTFSCIMVVLGVFIMPTAIVFIFYEP